MSHLSPLEVTYQGYIAAINARNWTKIIESYTCPTVTHNDVKMTAKGYTEMIERSLVPYGDVVFVPQMLIVDTPKGLVGCKLLIEHPNSTARLREHVFYQCIEGRISEVFSMVEEIK
jgi:predicted ester cyclase